MKIWMVRHTSVDVPAGTCYGQTDVPLKESFPEEAVQCKANLPEIQFDAVYTSPLTRCTRLATACGYPNARYDNRLKEMYFGEWEMQRFEDIVDPNIQEWYNDYLHHPASGGESFMDLYNRVASFLNEVRDSGKQNVLVFAHGGVLMTALLYSGKATPETIFSMQPPYGGMICLEL